MTFLYGDIYIENYSASKIQVRVVSATTPSRIFYMAKAYFYAYRSDSNPTYKNYITITGAEGTYMIPYASIKYPFSTISIESCVDQLNGYVSGGPTLYVDGDYASSPSGILNFIEGANISISISKNTSVGKTDITISATGGGGSGTVTSVDLSMPSAFTVSGNPITTAGTLNVTGAGTTNQYIDGTGALQSFNFSNLKDVNISGPVDGQFIRYDSVAGKWINMTVTFITTVTASAPLASTGGSSPDISISKADASTDGYLSSTDWNTFNNKADQVLTTKGDLYTFSTVPARLPKGLDTQILSADSSTTTGLKWTSNPTPPASGYYGVFQDSNSQTASLANTAYTIKIHTTDESNGVSIQNNLAGDPTRITVANTGTYNFQFSLQFENSNTNDKDAEVWFRKNEVDIPSSNSKLSVPGSHGATNGHSIAAWNYVITLVGGDYLELMWMVENTSVSLATYAAGSPPPATPSVILTVTQQAGIMAGTGVTAINGLSGAVQTFATGTTGTDFGISSSGTTHTFNLPTASATNRGLLSATDWSTFNSKQNAITIGTTAQYIRGDLSLATFPTIPSVGTWGALNYPTWTSGTPFVKMTAAGTFALDTNTYLTSVGTGTTNELTYWSGTNTIGSLSTSTYPSLTELSYLKGATSSIQTQLGNLGFSPWKYRTGDGTTLYSSQMYAGTNGTFTIAATATLRYMPLIVEKDSISINRLGIYVLSASAAGTKCRLGIYNSTAGFRPNALVLDAGEVAIDSTGQKNITGLSTTLTRGLYFLAVLNSAAGSINSVLSASMPDLFGTSSGAQNATSYFSHTQTYGTLPLTAAALTSNNGSMPAVYFAYS